MLVWVAKVICIAILLVITVVFAFIPRLISTHGNEKYLSAANCVAGGVLMGTTLLHLLPEVIEDVTEGFKEAKIELFGDYPIATCIVGIGFLVIVFIEMLAHTIQDHLIKSDDQELVQDFMENDEINLFDSMDRIRRYTRASSRGSLDRDSTSARSRSKSWRIRSYDRSDPERQTLLNNTVQNSRIPPVSQPVNNHPFNHGKSSSMNHESHEGEPHVHVHAQAHAHDHAPPTEIRSFGSILLLFALSVHSILEGMAVGSENGWTNVFLLTGALSMHKILLAFALGVKIVEEGLPLSAHIKSVVFFAISSPIGVSIGVAVSLATNIDGPTKQVTEGLIQAVATGTFLYIAFVEIITPELNKPDLPPLLKVLFLTIGYAIMCAVQLIPEGGGDSNNPNATITNHIIPTF